jgi:hypothetical protein
MEPTRLIYLICHQNMAKLTIIYIYIYIYIYFQMIFFFFLSLMTGMLRK